MNVVNDQKKEQACLLISSFECIAVNLMLYLIIWIVVIPVCESWYLSITCQFLRFLPLLLFLDLICLRLILTHEWSQIGF
jgi:hypothetical protein